MKFNYFYHAGSQQFKWIDEKNSQKSLASFWTGDKLKNFVSSTTQKINSTLSTTVHAVAHYPLNKFFSDSLNYSLGRMNEIKTDLVVNPVSPAFEKVSTSSKFSFKKFVAIGAATVALQMGATAVHNNVSTDFINTDQFSSLQASNLSHGSMFQSNINIKNQKNNAIASGQSLTDFFQQAITNSNPVESIRQDAPQAAVKLPKYMQSMFKTKEDAFLNLLNVAEGKQDRFYRDNKGIALAYGWNPTRNSKEFNLNIAKQAGLDEAQTAAIARVSNTTKVNFVPKDLKKMRFTSDQVDKIALALMPHYEQGFLDAMTLNAVRAGKNPLQYVVSYNALPNNQQAVMIHMAYKVGGDNLTNYKTFYKKLFSYIDKPTKTTLHQVQENFQYTYATLDGQRLHDTRVESQHSSFFSNCAINPDPKAKEKVSSKINECRNVANITNPELVQDMRTNVAGIQSRMSKMFT